MQKYRTTSNPLCLVTSAVGIALCYLLIRNLSVPGCVKLVNVSALTEPSPSWSLRSSAQVLPVKCPKSLSFLHRLQLDEVSSSDEATQRLLCLPKPSSFWSEFQVISCRSNLNRPSESFIIPGCQMSVLRVLFATNPRVYDIDESLAFQIRQARLTKLGSKRITGLSDIRWPATTRGSQRPQQKGRRELGQGTNN